MTLEQLQNRRNSCMQAIKDATAEKESIEKEMDSIALSQIKRSLQKYKISIFDLIRLLNSSGNQIKSFVDQLGKEDRENKNVS